MLNIHNKWYSFLLSGLVITGCSKDTHTHIGSHDTKHASTSQTAQHLLNLGTLEKCKQYHGLPPQWLKNPTAGMVLLPKGEFILGSNQGYPDELNLSQHKQQISSFWIDQTEVTVAQFQSFVKATGYQTDAEKQHQAAVFSPDQHHPQQWWTLKSGYTWQYPNGPNTPKAAANEPVRYVTKNDAEHYAVWLGRELATETEWEYAAKAGEQSDTPMYHHPTDEHQHPAANYWQGTFPFQNLKQDHFEGVAPVGCFAQNHFALYDTIGNVWEWTNSLYTGAHDHHMGNYEQLRKQQLVSSTYVIKGGSFLCADNYCARFRNSSRHPQEFDLATTHVGFRTIKRNL